MKVVSFEPVKVEAMINSLSEKREVFIVFYDDANNVKAVITTNSALQFTTHTPVFSMSMPFMALLIRWR